MMVFFLQFIFQFREQIKQGRRNMFVLSNEFVAWDKLSGQALNDFEKLFLRSEEKGIV